MQPASPQPLTVNRTLDVDDLAARFAAAGRLQITDFLTLDSAQALSEELSANSEWRRVINGSNKVFEIAPAAFADLPEAERARIDAAVVATAAAGFQFRYELIRVPDVSAQRDGMSSLLAAFARLMSAPETLALLRSVTGITDLRFADAQATLYRPGDFLTRHDDDVAGKDRRLAYVLGLTESWMPEWGGLLLFNDDHGGIAETFVPRFNTLSLFAVPQPHSVGYVAPYAARPRISVTGWVRSTIPG